MVCFCNRSFHLRPTIVKMLTISKKSILWETFKKSFLQQCVVEKGIYKKILVEIDDLKHSLHSSVGIAYSGHFFNA